MHNAENRGFPRDGQKHGIFAHKQELFVLGIVSFAALLFMFAFADQALTGLAMVEYFELFELGDTITPQVPNEQPRLPVLRLTAPQYNPALLPDREALTPQTLTFSVNRIPITTPNYYESLSLRDDRMHTYSASMGFYEEDVTPFLQGQLCAYAYKQMGAPLRCEPVELGYHDGVIGFARGYPEDEYIGNQAAGTDFAAFFVLANPQYGILATSPVAYLRWSKN